MFRQMRKDSELDQIDHRVALLSAQNEYEANRAPREPEAVDLQWQAFRSCSFRWTFAAYQNTETRLLNIPVVKGLVYVVNGEMKCVCLLPGDPPIDP